MHHHQFIAFGGFGVPYRTSKWNYLSRTTCNVNDLLIPLEDMIRKKLIPAISGRPAPNNEERDLLALPARLGGIGLVDPSKQSADCLSLGH